MFELRLFVSGQTAQSLAAIRNVHDIFAHDLGVPFDLQVVDVVANPELAEQNKILATPTLVVDGPAPRRRIVGDLSDRARVVEGLGRVPNGRSGGNGNHSAGIRN